MNVAKLCFLLIATSGVLSAESPQLESSDYNYLTDQPAANPRCTHNYVTVSVTPASLNHVARWSTVNGVYTLPTGAPIGLLLGNAVAYFQPVAGYKTPAPLAIHNFGCVPLYYSANYASLTDEDIDIDTDDE